MREDEDWVRIEVCIRLHGSIQFTRLIIDGYVDSSVDDLTSTHGYWCWTGVWCRSPLTAEVVVRIRNGGRTRLHGFNWHGWWLMGVSRADDVLYTHGYWGWMSLWCRSRLTIIVDVWIRTEGRSWLHRSIQMTTLMIEEGVESGVDI